MLAALGSDGATVEDLVDRWVQRGVSYTPDPAAAARYDRLYDIYVGLYPALAGSMHQLAAFTR
jgi:sugar (pentulose or hexulose) kinase